MHFFLALISSTLPSGLELKRSRRSSQLSRGLLLITEKANSVVCVVQHFTTLLFDSLFIVAHFGFTALGTAETAKNVRHLLK